MHIPTADLHIRQPGQDKVEAAPRPTFSQIHTLAKALKADLPTLFKGEVPAEALARSSQPKFASVVMPYQPVIDWYVQNTTHPCRCGRMTCLPESQAFAPPTCRTRRAIMRARKPDLSRRPGPRKRR